jgi:hypothetical protein
MTTKQPPRMAAHSSRRICMVRIGSYRSKKPRMKTVAASGDSAGEGRPDGGPRTAARSPGLGAGHRPAAGPRVPTA